jgi:hypothetical protein
MFVILTTSFVNALQTSLFFANKDRLNVVFYGKETNYYSLGIGGAGNYVIPFFADLKLQVPGGYGYYRVGALGKLVSLDKKPEILEKTFSLATYSFVDYYFYPQTDEVFYGSEKQDVALPSAKSILFGTSNASWIDKIYLAMQFADRKKNDFRKISLQSNKNKDGDEIFAADQFEKKYTGYLFQKSYRNEMKSVQILYAKEYENADRVGKMLEGNGIRVGDISPSTTNPHSCVIVEDISTPSSTAKMLMDFFHCSWKEGKTDIYDILFELGDKEKEWEIVSGD